MEVGFWRTSICWLFFALHAVFLGRIRIARGDLPAVVAFGLLGVGGLFGFYMLAVREGGAALAAVLLYTAPAWVAILSRLLLRETMTGAKVAAVAMTLAGVACISLAPALLGTGNGVHITLSAVMYGLLSGFSYALYYIFGERYLGRYETPTLFLFALPVGAAAMLPFFEFGSHAPHVWLTCIAIALFSTYIAYSIYYAGLRHLEATRAAVVATLEPVAAAVLAFAFWNERFHGFQYVGAGLILGSVLLTIWDGRRQSRRARLAVSEGPHAADPIPGR